MHKTAPKNVSLAVEKCAGQVVWPDIFLLKTLACQTAAPLQSSPETQCLFELPDVSRGD